MPPLQPRTLRAAVALLIAAAVSACSGAGSAPEPAASVTPTTTPFVLPASTPSPVLPADTPALSTATPSPVQPAPTATRVLPGAVAPAAAPTTAAAPPAATTRPSPPQAPPPSGPAILPSIQLDPAEIQQGGQAVVYLNQAATSASVTFNGRQYAMLQDGDRWWAIVGIGAFAELGQYRVVLNWTPAAGGAAQSQTVLLNVADKEYPVEYIELVPGAGALLAPEIVQNELNLRAGIYSSYTMQRLWSGPFVRPNGAALSSLYGEGRSYNGGPVTDYHRGTDFAGAEGAPVVAAARGRVAFTGQLQVRGGSIMIDHGAGVFTAYHHLSAVDVAEGQIVNAGERIGAVGSNGLVTGPHLHWEVIVRGVEVDGLDWLDGAEVGP